MSLFSELLNDAKNSEVPQRLLFMFAHAKTDPTKGGEGHQSGTIEPVMCVDKHPNELSSFTSLKEEADTYSKNWNFIFSAALVGKDGKEPTPDLVDLHLNKMSNGLANGDDLSKYAVWDRDEKLVNIGR